MPCWCSGPVLVQWSSSGPVLVKWSRVGAVVPCWCSGPVLVQWSSSGPVLVQWSSVSSPLVVPCWSHGPVLCWSAVQLLVARLVDVVDRDVADKADMLNMLKMSSYLLCQLVLQWSSCGPVLVQWSSVSSPLVVPCWSHGPVLCWSAVQLLVARLVDVVDRDVADKADMLNMLKMSSYLLCQLVLQWSSSGPMVPCCVGQLSSCSWLASWTWWTETSLTRPTCSTCSR